MVREAQKRDLGGLLKLYTHLHESETQALSETLIKTWDKIIADEDHHVIIYRLDEEIVSSCVCVIIPNLTRGVRPYALIENVVTRSDMRGKGYAAACLEFARELAEKENCYKMMLLTGAKDDETKDFYRKAGYNSEDKTGFIRWL